MSLNSIPPDFFPLQKIIDYHLFIIRIKFVFSKKFDFFMHRNQ